MWRAEEIEDEATLNALVEVARMRDGRAALSDALSDTLCLLPASPVPLLLLRLRLVRNLVACDTNNQRTFVLLSGPAAVVSSVLALQSLSPDFARAALGGDHNREAVWDALRRFARVLDAGVVDPLCMVLDTCCSGEAGRGRLQELCHEDMGLPILVELITTASRVGIRKNGWSGFSSKSVYRRRCLKWLVTCNDRKV